MTKIDEALKFAEISRSKQNSFTRRDALARFCHKRGNVAVITSGGLRLHGARLNSLFSDGEVIEF